MPLSPIARRSLSDGVYEQLFAQIIDGERSPGERLPAERSLCSTLGVNRGAVREALKRLSQAGLIEVRHGGGNTVLDFKRRGGLALLPRLLFRPDGVNVGVARSIMEMRTALAPDMAKMCARRASRDQLRALEASLQRFEDCDALDAASVAALELWDGIAQGSDNVAYRLAFNTLRETYEGIRTLLVQALADELRDVQAHAALVAAISARDETRAAECARAITERGSAGVLGLLEWIEPEPRP